jgi:hypothetical protein
MFWYIENIIRWFLLITYVVTELLKLNDLLQLSVILNNYILTFI